MLHDPQWSLDLLRLCLSEVNQTEVDDSPHQHSPLRQRRLPKRDKKNLNPDPNHSVERKRLGTTVIVTDAILIKMNEAESQYLMGVQHKSPVNGGHFPHTCVGLMSIYHRLMILYR